jgi:ribonucleoside-triphosphate reductase (thioredoxin)
MHIGQFPQIEDDIRWAFDQVRQKRVLGSQRALQYAGEPILRKNARVYNCTVSYCDRPEFFQEALWLLLCGCGVGFSVQKHHIAKLPEFHAEWYSAFKEGESRLEDKTFVIEDSIEGWADALGILLSSFLPVEGLEEWKLKNVVFDYSKIRLKGSPLSSGVGKAPGPEPLMKALEAIRALLVGCIAGPFRRLRPIDAYDLVMHASDAVLSGGVRRSATICVFSHDDEEMITAKTGNWFYTNPQRGRSNNSALLLRSTTTREQFHNLMASVRQYGEPGFVWADSLEILFNPCVEIGMYPVDVITGKSGWSFCNLCEINGKKCVTKEDFAKAARAAAIIGTLQASYTNFDYLGPITEAIVRREALLGVSITGMMDSPDVLFNPEIQREVARLVVEVNKEIATKIGINQAARTTCVKPAGTTSCILGTSSGIHAHHAKRYIRRVQANMLEAPFQFFSKINPRAVEKSVWSKNGTDGVISFCIETSDAARTRKDVNAIKLLEHVKLTQNNWVEAGKVPELCTQPWLKHNVSNTINVKEDEWEMVEEFIYENRDSFAGVSLLSQTGDLDYPQAPFTAVYTPTELVKLYGDGSLMASGLIVDGLAAFKDNLWLACDAVLGYSEDPMPKPYQHFDIASQQLVDTLDEEYMDRVSEWAANQKLRINWIRRAKQYAERYHDGDTRLMTYCLKSVNNWKLWCDLNREYAEVEYDLLIEEEDNTTIQDTIACAGGKCEI